MKLTESKIIKGNVPDAWTEPAHRHTIAWTISDATNLRYSGIDQFESTRFKLVVDETDTVLATVTDRYTLVRNRELVSALDMAADSLGLEIEPTKARYRNGRSMYDFNLPGLEFQVGNDPSKTVGNIQLRNDYRGGGGLGIMAGWFRVVCTNGLITGEIAHKNLLRHVGEIDPYPFVLAALQTVQDRFEIDRMVAESLADVSTGKALQVTHLWPDTRDKATEMRENMHPDDPGAAIHLIAEILSDTPDRYHQYLRDNAASEAHEMGDNLWALSQLIARTATHRMKGTFTPDEWAARQLSRIRQYAEV